MAPSLYDVIVIGGGPVGLAATYEVAKAGKKVLVLEQNNFYNQAGSSPDLVRMFRTMYTEDFMAKLAKKSMGFWNDLERDAGESLRWMSGLLNFGDARMGENTPEGTLLGPIDNLKKLNMAYQQLTAQEIQDRWPFKNLPDEWEGLYAPDNGVVNVPLLLRSLLRLAKDYGADAKQHAEVTSIAYDNSSSSWRVDILHRDKKQASFHAIKIILASGAYVNHVLQPSFGIHLDLDIWEMTASYFNTNAGPNGTIFPSMWFQFAPNDERGRSRLFYGFPAVPWGPPNLARIAVDAATRRIKDPRDRSSSEINAQDIADTQAFVRDHVVGVDATAPVFNSTCLQTNVFDNMFVLDYLPKEYLRGGPEKSVAVFTAGWAMKFVPLLGRALADMALNGGSEFALEAFAITRTDDSGQGIIRVDDAGEAMQVETSSARPLAGTQVNGQASGSSRHQRPRMGH
ncbi:Peroxisomal sarcosine oxidase [Madurella mycetomatis]|uniref:Peroxisomal sarcosine oxidase n=1 Tax=Madurella mycetomatis TaxID=100816 RepID=A0A175WAH0_9PEZI|nr:Peroxisomal sarcosine oxidase [Madurella mycetomatis]